MPQYAWKLMMNPLNMVGFLHYTQTPFTLHMMHTSRPVYRSGTLPGTVLASVPGSILLGEVAKRYGTLLRPVLHVV